MKFSLNRELESFNLSQKIIDEVLTRALERGGELAELYFESVDSTRIVREAGRVDRMINGRDQGGCLRILYQGRSVHGYTTDLSSTALMSLAEKLSAAISGQSRSGSARDRDWILTQASSQEIAHYQIQHSPRLVSIQDKVNHLIQMERAARSELKDLRQITTIWMDSLRNILVVNSDGLVSKDSKTYLQWVCQVVGEREGRVESAYESDGGFVGMEFLQTRTLESLGQEAARRVRVLLEAKPAPAGVMPVVISSEAGGTMVHEAVGHGLEADLACQGLSVYQNQLGKTVASPLVTVIDDGTLLGKRGSYRFDDEGTPSQKTVLIENGVLKSYMVDRLSAMKFDLMATGNGRRESFRNKPIVRMTNTYIAPGKDDPKEILKSTEWGIFVKSMGGGQVNTVTGDFVFAVTEAYLIHQGQLGEPIRGATLVGNGPKVLCQIDRVGNDLGFSTGTCGKDGQGAPVTDAQPTLRISELTVGGEVPLKTYWSAKAES